MQKGTRLMMIRHAPSLHEGRLAGRRDVSADLSGKTALAALRATLARADLTGIVTSPALRCQQTAQALWPEQAQFAQDARLWEQDFGAWEGMVLSDLPDLGPQTRAALAGHRPPEGESFCDLCARVHPVLDMLAEDGGTRAIIAHAGVIRAALALALDNIPAALAFEIAPLSLTEINSVPGYGWSVARVNQVVQ